MQLIIKKWMIIFSLPISHHLSSAKLTDQASRLKLNLQPTTTKLACCAWHQEAKILQNQAAAPSVLPER
jgi:hypothetical protein